jgi:ATP-dependent DNA helicase RecG
MQYPEEESATLEFKESIPKHAQIMKTVVGFCNRKGGRMIIGIKNDRTIVGLPSEVLQQVLETLDEAIYSASTPHIIPHIYVQRIGDVNILIIEVSSGMNKPYWVKSEGAERGIYVRLGRSTLLASSEIIQELQWESRGRSLDSLPAYSAKEEDLDWAEIRRFFRLSSDEPIDPTFLLGHRLLVQEHGAIYPTTAAILVFGKKPQMFFSESIIICCHFIGTSGREALATIDCEGPLLQQFKEAFHFISSRLSRSFTIKGPVREEILEVPEMAIREAVLNMIVHRNYHIPGPSKIFIYDDRIEFFSPGDIPGSFNVHNLRSGLTFLRNPIICSFFRRAGLIEKLGTGFITMLDTAEKKGLEPPRIIEGENFLKCILSRKKLERKKKLTEVEIVINYLKQVQSASISEFMELLSLPRTTCYRRLEKFVKEGVLERTGESRSAKYILKTHS